MELDSILEKYDLTNYSRDQLADYIMALHLNQADTADKIGVHRQTVNQKLNKAFDQMTPYERATVITTLAEERRRDILGPYDP